MRGHFGIGVFHPKTSVNVGTLWRSAYQLGASWCFTIGRRYERQSSDTYATWRHLPMHEFEDFESFKVPFGCPLIGVETAGQSLLTFEHPERAVYLLGAEDHGLPQAALDRCVRVVSIPAVRRESYNVAVAGSLVMWDRLSKSSVESRVAALEART